MTYRKWYKLRVISEIALTLVAGVLLSLFVLDVLTSPKGHLSINITGKLELSPDVPNSAVSRKKFIDI